MPISYWRDAKYTFKRTCLCNTDNITVHEADGYGLALDRRWLLVTDLTDDVEDGWWD